jgi:hypothetical protein
LPPDSLQKLAEGLKLEVLSFDVGGKTVSVGQTKSLGMTARQVTPHGGTSVLDSSNAPISGSFRWIGAAGAPRKVVNRRMLTVAPLELMSGVSLLSALQPVESAQTWAVMGLSASLVLLIGVMLLIGSGSEERALVLPGRPEPREAEAPKADRARPKDADSEHTPHDPIPIPGQLAAPEEQEDPFAHFGQAPPVASLPPPIADQNDTLDHDDTFEAKTRLLPTSQVQARAAELGAVPDDDEDIGGTTRVMPVSQDLLAASAAQPAESMPPVRVTGSRPAPAIAALTDEDQHLQDVFEEFVATRELCGEAADGLTFEKFSVKLRKNREQLVQKLACRTVRFQVYVKEGKAAIKASPVRD